MRVVAAAQLVLEAGAGTTILAEGSFEVLKTGDDTRSIRVYEGGGLIVKPDGGYSIVKGKDAPVIAVTMSSAELRLLIVEAMKVEGIA